MSLRPAPARWFELLTSRDDLTTAVATLARTGNVELETHSEVAERLTLPDLQSRMAEYHRLARRYQPYWPTAELLPTTPPGQPVEQMDRALARLRAWQQEADPLIGRIETRDSEQTDLALLQEMLSGPSGETVDLGLVAAAGPALRAGVFVLPAGTRISELPGTLLARQVAADEHLFLLTVGAPAEIARVEQDLALRNGRPLGLPAWLEGNARQAGAQVDERRATLAEELEGLQQRLHEVARRHRLAAALSDIAHLEWFVTHVSGLPVSENFAWVTGWTSDLSGTALRDALARARVQGMVHFPSPPLGTTPPLVMANPRWAQPFELFTRLLGTPARDEVDPSRLLAVIAPLLFGYMFGDVGQGLVLFVAGLLLSRRWPVLRILIPGGLAAAGFGWVFGSVFGLEHLLAPLWVRPMEQPLPVLVVPLLAGMCILLVGLVLNGVEAYWRGELARWWRVEAAVLVLYLGIVGCLFSRWSATAAGIGLLWYLAGSTWQAPRRPFAELASAFGRLLESVMQLLINTLSFVRVGAFALAHAGLSLAFVALADATGSAMATVVAMVLGNVIVIMLEGLVVSIQTTRLILFEFFIRFLRGEGRVFRPLPAPTTLEVDERKKQT